MAIVNAGTVVELGSPFLPLGYVKPTVTTFDDEFYEAITKTITVLKSSTENADPVIGLTDLVTAVGSAIDVILANDYVASNTVDAYGVFKSVSTTLDVKNDGLYNSTAVSYVCIVDIFVKVS